MKELFKINQTMSSLEISELTGKLHKSVLRDIDNMFKELDILTAQFCAQYKDSTGRSLRMFNLPKRETLILVSGYNIKLRSAIIDRWEYLEDGLQSRLKAKMDVKFLNRELEDFIPYALGQGSTNADKYYLVYAKLVNNLMGIDSGKRGNLDKEDNRRLSKIMSVIHGKVQMAMLENIPYKKVYREIKDYLTKYFPPLKLEENK